MASAYFEGRRSVHTRGCSMRWSSTETICMWSWSGTGLLLRAGVVPNTVRPVRGSGNKNREILSNFLLPGSVGVGVQLLEAEAKRAVSVVEQGRQVLGRAVPDPVPDHRVVGGQQGGGQHL